MQEGKGWGRREDTVSGVCSGTAIVLFVGWTADERDITSILAELHGASGRGRTYIWCFLRERVTEAYRLNKRSPRRA